MKMRTKKMPIIKTTLVSLALLSSTALAQTKTQPDLPTTLDEILNQKREPTQEHAVSADVLKLEQDITGYMKTVIEPLASYHQSFDDIKNTYEKQKLVTSALAKAQTLRDRITKEGLVESKGILTQVTEYSATIKETTKTVEEEISKIAALLREYNAVKAKVRAEDFLAAKDEASALLSKLGKTTFNYEADIRYRLNAKTGTTYGNLQTLAQGNFQGLASLTSEVSRYKRDSIDRKASEIEKITQDSYTLIKSFDTILRRRDADDILDIERKCDNLISAMQHPRYRAEATLKQSLATYRTKAHSTLVGLKEEKLSEFRELYNDMVKEVNRGNLEEAKRLNQRLSRDTERFKKSPLSGKKYDR